MVTYTLMFPFVRYLENHLNNLFAGAWESRDVSPLPVDIPQASDDQVRIALCSVPTTLSL